jgi:hypothetical protein
MFMRLNSNYNVVNSDGCGGYPAAVLGEMTQLTADTQLFEKHVDELRENPQAADWGSNGRLWIAGIRDGWMKGMDRGLRTNGNASGRHPLEPLDRQLFAAIAEGVAA